MVQICRLENIEHKSIKQVSYNGKYSFSAYRANALEQPECGHTPFLIATGFNIWLSPVVS